ncbi:unnamed protein product [Euphydryas editha]|uniref:Uncharacterized protein n=1 Tax=Euphydryas editha TaxID=104508 RepID=A0AAU9TE66_EUPED|nr:unnamed protein product [Euphydryas editha]
MEAINCRLTGNLSKRRRRRCRGSGRVGRRAPSGAGAGRGRRAVCVTDHGGAGGPRPAALVKRARRIRATARLKAIRPPGGRRARLAAASSTP